jgi:hypothetical protein
MSNRIRIIKHEAVHGGSFEVWFADGRKSQFFCWAEIPDRWLRPGGVGSGNCAGRSQSVCKSCARPFQIEYPPEWLIRKWIDTDLTIASRYPAFPLT